MDKIKEKSKCKRGNPSALKYNQNPSHKIFSNKKIHLFPQITVIIGTFLVTPSYLYLLLALTVVKLYTFP